jgi:hypothetical protein
MEKATEEDQDDDWESEEEVDPAVYHSSKSYVPIATGRMLVSGEVSETDKLCKAF